jgi:hypothetical protein
MTMHRMKMVLIAAPLAVGSLLGIATMAQADETLNQILKVGEAKNVSAAKSQVKIDKLADETRELLGDYKTVNKQIDGLKVYNTRLQNQIDNQIARIGDIEKAISDVTVIQRQMTPLVIRMIDGLEKFVELDVPFHMDERRKRVAFLRSNLDRSDVSVAEKFRQVLEAYKIESEYGRKLDAYKGSVEIDGAERDVNFFRVGRIALVYQTTDTELTGAWDQANRAWVPLDRGEFRTAIMKGLRIARKEAAIDVMQLPIAAPEVAQQ